MFQCILNFLKVYEKWLIYISVVIKFIKNFLFINFFLETCYLLCSYFETVWILSWLYSFCVS